MKEDGDFLMKEIGIILLSLGVLGILMAVQMFGDIGVACGVAALCSLVTGVGFLKTDKMLKGLEFVQGKNSYEILSGSQYNGNVNFTKSGATLNGERESMRNLCPNCGSQIIKGAKFCGVCGTSIGNRNVEEELTSSSINIKDGSYATNISERNTILDRGWKENFFNPNGKRLNRLRYFKRVVLTQLILGGLGNVGYALIISGNNLGYVMYLSCSILQISILYCLSVRRLHDLDKAELLAQINAGISIVSVIVSLFYPINNLVEKMSYGITSSPVGIMSCLLILYVFLFSAYLIFVKGTVGENRYGSDPLDNTKK